MPDTIPERQSKLLDQLRRCLSDKHYSVSTERTYVYWAKWYIRFHCLRHPSNMGAPAVQAELSYLVNGRQVAVITYTQA